MARTCLPKKYRDALLNTLKSGEISLAELYKMTDTERRDFFKKYVGDNASFVNAKFEQAMLSNQKTAFVNWINQTTSQKDPIRRDMLKRVERVEKFLSATEEKEFMEDLASMKLGIGISEGEAKTLLEMRTKIDEAKEKITDDMPNGSKERLEYGYALDDFKQFVGERKLEARSLKIGERFLPKNWWRNIVDVAGLTKSLKASFDMSFVGRQGIKLLLSWKFADWGKLFKNNISLFSKELFSKSKGFFKGYDDAVMRSTRAEVLSRKNALNGKYTAAKNGYGLGVEHEEAFPTSWAERIPIIGKIFKGAETAFSAGALIARADLADATIANAEQNGVDMLDQQQASAHANIVTAMTGRGEIGSLAAQRWVNPLFFSIRFLKSNFDTLTAHQFQRGITPEARKLAAINTLKIASSIGSVLGTAALLGFKVEPDPRSSKFGQICYKNRCIDITGGMRGIVTLASRIVPTYNDGQWGFWTKSGTTGKYTQMGQGTYGEQTALDTFEAFFEGKLSPTAGLLRDIWKGQNFQGDKPSFVNSTIGLIVPISVETLIDEIKKGNDDVLIVMLAEAFGISQIDYTMKLSGKKWETLKVKVDEKTLNDAMKSVTERFNERAEKLEQSVRWNKMDNDERTDELEKIRSEETSKIFKRYNIK